MNCHPERSRRRNEVWNGTSTVWKVGSIKAERLKEWATRERVLSVLGSMITCS